MDVFVDPGAKLDSAAHTVTYNVTVTPGEQYRVHTVTPEGLTSAAQADFNKMWRMKRGELYDPAYVAGFFKNNTAVRSFEGFSCSYRVSADAQTHLVDLTLSCLHTGIH